jgi:trk system potassium uptake protein TrkA
MKKKRFTVIGLGTLGESLAKGLAQLRAEVIALDIDPQKVDRIKDMVTVAVEGNSTDRKTLEQLGVRSADTVFVCIGEDLEAAVLTVAHCLDLGCKHVAVKAHSRTEDFIFRRLGAHDVFYVEMALGEALAKKYCGPAAIQGTEIGAGYRIVEWKAPPGIVGRSLIEAALPARYRLQVVAVKGYRDGNSFTELPKADSIINDGDTIFVFGHERDLTQAYQELSAPPKDS